MSPAPEPPLPAQAPLAAAPLAAASAPAADERASLRGVLGMFRRYRVTSALSLACGAIHVLGWYWGKGSQAVIGLMGANHRAFDSPGEWHRLLASVLLHGSGAHLFVNLAGLVSLAPLFEMFLGGHRLLVLFTLSGLAGSLASALANPESYSVGASGAIFGLLGALVATDVRGTLRHGKPNYKLWGVLIFNVLLSLLPGIDGAAHLGGGVLGFAYGALASPPIFDPVRLSPAQRQAGRGTRLAAAACAVALAGSLAFAVFEGRPWRLAAEPEWLRAPVSITGLSLDVPVLVGEEARVNGDLESGGVVYGVSSLSPMRIAIVFERGAGAPGDVARAMDVWERELNEQWGPTDPEGQLISQKRVAVGARSAILRKERLESGDGVLRYDQIVGPYRVTLMVIRSWNDRRVWPDIEERIAASLRFEPP